MKPTLKFIWTAIKRRTAYVDLDGCLVRKMPIPSHIRGRMALEWWIQNLAPMPVVYRRLVLLYVLRMFGVKLIIWTNRQWFHADRTRASLGAHMWLFHCSYYLEGDKGVYARLGPLMDDQAKYITDEGDLLVKQL